MLDDGLNVILSEEMKTKLYMSADDFVRASEATDAEKDDPTYNMTADQRARYLKKKARKPRPREFYDINAILMKIYEKKLKQS